MLVKQNVYANIAIIAINANNGSCNAENQTRRDNKTKLHVNELQLTQSKFQSDAVVAAE